MRLLRQAWTVALKDLRSELRTKESLNAAGGFALVILVVFSFVVDPTETETIYALSGGLLWLVFAFAGVLILNRAFAREQANDCLDALIASPLSPAALVLGKSFAGFILLLIVELPCLPVFGGLYGLSRWSSHLPELTGVVLLATWGMTVIGTVFSALTVNLRLRELMLPMLVYPLLIPVLISAMRLCSTLISGEAIQEDDAIWIRLLIAFDIIFTSLALVLAEDILVS
jgi:heme exporter protein B